MNKLPLRYQEASAFITKIIDNVERTCGYKGDAELEKSLGIYSKAVGLWRSGETFPNKSYFHILLNATDFDEGSYLLAVAKYKTLRSAIASAGAANKWTLGTSLCLDCQNGYVNKCDWVGKLKPIEGWKALTVYMRDGHKMAQQPTDMTDVTISYCVQGCPNFIPCKQRAKDRTVGHKFPAYTY
jgi:hypothetical protein